MFTGIKISPSLLSRQRPNYYTIHARQNLPDKEFRSLRTVIVTAAVHWGFRSMLITSPFNLPALGRHHLIYIVLRLSIKLCFC